MWKTGTFSKRQKKRKDGAKTDVYQYEDLPGPFRVQVVHMWRTALGTLRERHPLRLTVPASNRYWSAIHDDLSRELGVFTLDENEHDPFSSCVGYLLKSDTNGALDIIEATFRLMDEDARNLSPSERAESGITQDPDDAIQELNFRFKEHGIGYEFVSGELVRIDSQYIHTEVVKPAISLLQEVGFAGAVDEFSACS
jgi:hypothetical protein